MEENEAIWKDFIFQKYFYWTENLNSAAVETRLNLFHVFLTVSSGGVLRTLSRLLASHHTQHIS